MSMKHPYICTACNKRFKSLADFDNHRTGEHGVKQGQHRRRCLDESEMIAFGFRLQNGIWTRAKPMSADTAARLTARRIRHDNKAPATPLAFFNYRAKFGIPNGLNARF